MSLQAMVALESTDAIQVVEVRLEVSIITEFCLTDTTLVTLAKWE